MTVIFQNRGKQYNGPMRIRIVPATGAEKFAEFIYNKLNKFVKEETNNRVRVQKVEFREHNKKRIRRVPSCSRKF